MSVIISKNMTLSAKPLVGSGRPIFAWRNYVTRANISATYSTVDKPISNLGNPNTALYWRSESINEQEITVEIGGGQLVDYVALARHNLGTGFVEIKVDAVISGFDDDDFVTIINGRFLGTDEPVLILFPEIYPTKIRITLRPTDKIPQIGILYVGKSTVMLRGMAQDVTPLAFSYETEFSTGRSESGDFLGRVITDQTRRVAYTFEMINYEWFKEELGEFSEIALTRPFFFSWLPSMFPDEVGFGWLNQDIKPIAKHVTGGVHVDFSMDITALSR